MGNRPTPTIALTPDQQQMLDQSPLISDRFVWRLTAIIAVLALISVVLSIAGRIVGERVAMAGHTTDETRFELVIGNDVLSTPANTIRFERQRKTGVHPQVDLYALYPKMIGYKVEYRNFFNTIEQNSPLVFLSLSRREMSADMSDRYAVVYTHLLDNRETVEIAGLTGRRLKSVSGYDGEWLFVEKTANGRPFVAKCLDSEVISELASQGDFCQRDVHVGTDLTVLYRFPRSMLASWKDLDARVQNWINSMLVDQ